MIDPSDPNIRPRHAELLARIRAQGVEGWLSEKAQPPSLDSLVYLCKFAYFTGMLQKSQIGAILGVSRDELKRLVRAWYDDHRQKGCGTC